MASRYRFSVDTENEDGRTIFSNTLEFDAEQLDDVLGNFELFLKGAGFELRGHVDIVPGWNEHNDPVDNWPDPAYDDLDPAHNGLTDPPLTEQAEIHFKRADDSEGGTVA